MNVTTRHWAIFFMMGAILLAGGMLTLAQAPSSPTVVPTTGSTTPTTSTGTTTTLPAIVAPTTNRDSIPAFLTNDHVLVISDVDLDMTPILMKWFEPTNAGAGIIGYAKDGKLYAILLDTVDRAIFDDDEIQFYVYQVGNDQKFYELDCVGVPSTLEKHEIEGVSLTMDGYITKYCMEDGQLDIEDSYGYLEDTFQNNYFTGSQFFKDSFAKGNAIIQELVGNGTYRLTQFSTKTVFIPNEIVEDALSDVPGRFYCPNPIPVSDGLNNTWTVTPTPPLTNVVAATPECYELEGTPTYMLEVFRVAEVPTVENANTYFKVGMRLFHQTSRGWNLVDGKAQHLDRYDLIAGKPTPALGSETIPMSTPALIKVVSTPTKSLVLKRTDGRDIDITYDITKDGISKIVVRASSHAALVTQNKYQFKFTTDTENAIRTALKKPGYNIYEDPQNKLSFTLRGSYDVTRVLYSAATTPHLFAAKDATTLKEMIPGTYTLVMKIEGYEDFPFSKSLDYEDFSPPPSASGPAVIDIKNLKMDLTKLVPTTCSACSTVAECKACLEAKVVRLYTPATPQP